MWSYPIDKFQFVGAGFFLRKLLGTQYGPDFFDFRDPIFSDSRELIFNSRDPNQVPKTS